MLLDILSLVFLIILGFLLTPFISLWIIYLLFIGKTWRRPYLEHNPYNELLNELLVSLKKFGPYSKLPRILSERQFKFLTILISILFTLGIAVFFLSFLFKHLAGSLILIVSWSIIALLTIGITIKYRRKLQLSRNEYIGIWLQFILILITIIYDFFNSPILFLMFSIVAVIWSIPIGYVIKYRRLLSLSRNELLQLWFTLILEVFFYILFSLIFLISYG
jgi:hypothetical protein